MTAARYDDAVGWVRIDELLTPAQAVAIAEECQRVLAQVGRDATLQRVGDKPHAGTRRLVDVDERVPATAELLVDPRLTEVLEAIVGPHHAPTEFTYRSPQPGYGGQRLHADDVPRLQPPSPGSTGPVNDLATTIVALTEFTTSNGATRLVPGSNHRPDLQRRAGTLDRHEDEVLLAGPPGTAFVFSGHVLHSGTENRSSAPRPALQLVVRTDRPAGGR